MTLAVDTQNLHPSTQTCLMGLQWLEERKKCDSILEIGCGNGILSIVAAHVWPARVMAADIAPKAVHDATLAVAGHELQDRITVVRSDGFSNLLLMQSGPYDLIIANLLAHVLVRLALDIKKCLNPDGYILLAGMQTWLAPDTEKAYRDLGFEIAKQFEISPWKTLILRPVTKA